MSGDLLPVLRPDPSEQERNTAGQTLRGLPSGGLTDDQKWMAGHAMVVLNFPFDPNDPKLRSEAMERLVAMAEAYNPAATKWMRFWRRSWDIPDDLRVPGKTWAQHDKALDQSDPRYGRRNVKLALRLLAEEEDAIEQVDPFRGSPLTGKQLTAARRMFRFTREREEEFADREVTQAVAAALRGQRKKGFTMVANAAHALAQQRLKEAEEVARAQQAHWINQLINSYYTQLLKTTDASYQLKMIFEGLPPELRDLVRKMIEGGTLSAYRAIDDLSMALLGE